MLGPGADARNCISRCVLEQAAVIITSVSTLGQKGRNVRWPPYVRAELIGHNRINVKTGQTDRRTHARPLLYALRCGQLWACDVMSK